MKRTYDEMARPASEPIQASMTPPVPFDPKRERVGVDIGSSNFAAVLLKGKLGEVIDALHVSLREHCSSEMNLYSFAPAVTAMVDSYPNIFKRGRYLCIENQITGQEHSERVKNPNMPIIAGALIGYACSPTIGMVFLPVYPTQMYMRYYGRSRGSNEQNKAMTLRFVPPVMTPAERTVINNAYIRKTASAKARGDTAKSTKDHLYDAAVMGWYGSDQHTGFNTYDAREDKEEDKTSYESSDEGKTSSDEE